MFFLIFQFLAALTGSLGSKHFIIFESKDLPKDAAIRGGANDYFETPK